MNVINTRDDCLSAKTYSHFEALSQSSIVDDSMIHQNAYLIQDDLESRLLTWRKNQRRF